MRLPVGAAPFCFLSAWMRRRKPHLTPLRRHRRRNRQVRRIAEELPIFGQKCVYFPLVGVEFQARKGVRHTGKLKPSLRFVVAYRWASPIAKINRWGLYPTHRAIVEKLAIDVALGGRS